jgi:DNA primase
MVIPVIFGGKVVSFQAADLTGKADLKYKTATSNINNYLYGYDEIQDNGRIIVTEGVLDAWRVGNDAVCTFGTHLTDLQRNLIIGKKPRELIFAYDGDYYWREFGHGSIPGWFVPFVDTIRVVEFPVNHDPDSYGKEHGCEELRRLILSSGEV